MFSRFHMFQHEQQNVVIPTCIPSLHDAQTGTRSEKQRRENHRSSYKFGDQCVSCHTYSAHTHTLYTHRVCVLIQEPSVLSVGGKLTDGCFSAERKKTPIALTSAQVRNCSISVWVHDDPAVKKNK